MIRAIQQQKTLTRLILEQLGEIGEAAIDVFFPYRYPEARMWRRLLGLDAGYRFKRESFSTLLSRLHAQGLVARSGPRRRSTWRITPRGSEFLRPHLAKADGVGRIVAFDIPERERRKRDAIRLELVAAGYHQLQRSVWYGERPLPEDFITARAEYLAALRRG